MKTNTFLKILLVVLIVCLILTAVHIIYSFYAYEHASIIYFIAKELW